MTDEEKKEIAEKKAAEAAKKKEEAAEKKKAGKKAEDPFTAPTPKQTKTAAPTKLAVKEHQGAAKTNKAKLVVEQRMAEEETLY